MVNTAPLWGLVFATLGLIIVLLVVWRKVKGGTKIYDIRYREETNQEISSRDASLHDRTDKRDGEDLSEHLDPDGEQDKPSINSGERHTIQNLDDGENPELRKRTRRFIKRNKGT